MRSSWTTAVLGEVCTIRPPKYEARERVKGTDEVSFVPMEDLPIGRKFVVPRQARKLSEVEGSYTYFADGDVLLAKITPCFENGKLGIARGLISGIGFGSSEFIVLRPKSTILSEYLYYYLAQDGFRLEGIGTMGGAVGQQRIDKDFVPSHKIPLPPVSEQRRIVAILDEAFEAIATAKANAERNGINSSEFFEVNLNRVFHSELAHRPKVQLSDLIDILHGYAFDGDEFARSDDATKPIVLTPGNYSEDCELNFTPKNTKRFVGIADPEYLFQPGDLTVVMTDLSSKMKLLGKPAFVDRPNILHNQRIGRVKFTNCMLNPRFLYFFLQTESVLRHIKESATGTMVKHTAPKRILSNCIPWPVEPAHQLEIVKRLDQMTSLSRQLRLLTNQRSDLLSKLKQRLLENVFAGRLRMRPSNPLRVAAE